MNTRVRCSRTGFPALVLACLGSFPVAAQDISRSPEPARGTIKAAPVVVRLEVEVPSVPQIVCRTTIHSAALECKPSGTSHCPTDVLFQRGPDAPLQSCPAKCALQSASGARCDCTFVADQCRDVPAKGRQ